MSKVFAFLIALTGLSLVALDADAARMGGGRNVGTQRAKAVSPARPPAQQQAAPGNPTPQKAAPAAAPTPSLRA